MKTNDQRIAILREKVNAAQQEFDMAVAFHEAWKPTAYDGKLHKRMGESYATNAFLVVRTALRREMLLALMRLWDKDRRSVGMESVAETLRQTGVIDTLAAGRLTRIGFAEAEDHIRKELVQRADEVIALIGKYSKDGSSWAVRDKLQKLRHERLVPLHSDFDCLNLARIQCGQGVSIDHDGDSSGDTRLS